MADRSPPSAARVATLIAVPLALIAGLAAYWLLGGFTRSHVAASAPVIPGATGPVSVPAPSLDSDRASTCHSLASQLPRSLREVPRRPVAPDVDGNAAYGDPPITVAC